MAKFATLIMNVLLPEKKAIDWKKALDRVKRVSLFHNTFIGGHYFLDFFLKLLFLEGKDIYIRFEF